MAEVTAVITCMTDGERPFLLEAIRSVQAQTAPTDIIVCVADTNTWIHDLLSQAEPGVRLLQMPLKPAGLVRNAAVDAADTELVAFLDGDDVWVPTKVERQVALLRRHDLDVIATKHVLIREDGKAFFYAFARGIPMTSSWLGRTSVFRDIRFTDRQVGQDVELWHKLEPHVRMGVAEQFLLRYRIRQGSASKATPSMLRKRAYERRSRTFGGRPALLALSWLANLALRVRSTLRPEADGGLARVR
jgi:glycosyltransferase involved in cell wall biosynthesis